MGLQLRGDLHWCVCGGRAVFLDLDQDRYFCLSKAANDAFLELAAGKLQTGHTEKLSSMISRGLLVEAGASFPFPQPPTIARPASDYINEQVPRAPLLGVFRALVAELNAAWRLKTRSLGKALHSALEQEPGPALYPTFQNGRLGLAIASFNVASLITRSHNRCLVRALAVQSSCRRMGLRSKLVIGVSANPFAAHCWVQLGSAVLVGGFEQARLYAPILVVE